MGFKLCLIISHLSSFACVHLCCFPTNLEIAFVGWSKNKRSLERGRWPIFSGTFGLLSRFFSSLVRRDLSFFRFLYHLPKRRMKCWISDYRKLRPLLQSWPRPFNPGRLSIPNSTSTSTQLLTLQIKSIFVVVTLSARNSSLSSLPLDYIGSETRKATAPCDSTYGFFHRTVEKHPTSPSVWTNSPHMGLHLHAPPTASLIPCSHSSTREQSRYEWPRPRRR